MIMCFRDYDAYVAYIGTDVQCYICSGTFWTTFQLLRYSSYIIYFREFRTDIEDLYHQTFCRLTLAAGTETNATPLECKFLEKVRSKISRHSPPLVRWNVKQCHVTRSTRELLAPTSEYLKGKNWQGGQLSADICWRCIEEAMEQKKVERRNPLNTRTEDSQLINEKRDWKMAGWKL